MLLVTGGTGFIGANLLARLAAQGTAARCLVRDLAAARAGRIPCADLVRGDVRDPATLAPALAGVTHVVHLAGVVRALTPEDFDRGNHLGTRNLVHALQRQPGAAPPRLVHLSSLAAVGPSTDGRGTDRPARDCAPISVYGRSKRDAEAAIATADGTLRWVVLRPPAVYGPGDRDLLTLFRSARRGVVALAGPDRPFSFVHVDDVVAAILAALASEKSGLCLPVTAAPPLRGREIVDLLARAVGRRARAVRLPLFAAHLAGAGADLFARLRGKPSTFSRDKVVEMAAAGWVADPEPARRELRWSAARDHESGFAATAEWYRTQGWLRPV